MHGRRNFLRHVVLRGLEEFEKAGRAIAAVAGDVTGSDPNKTDRILRPPGALAESAFLAKCSQCGDCVQACPASCIVIDPTLGQGRPVIVAQESPCVVCEDLSCMKVCPTGALELVARVEEIDMGLAAVDHDRCLRRHGSQGKTCGSESAEVDSDCRLCVDQCPLGSAAIDIDEAGEVAVTPGCIGCGVCERVCPTEPSSIVVIPSRVVG